MTRLAEFVKESLKSDAYTIEVIQPATYATSRIRNTGRKLTPPPTYELSILAGQPSNPDTILHTGNRPGHRLQTASLSIADRDGRRALTLFCERCAGKFRASPRGFYPSKSMQKVEYYASPLQNLCEKLKTWISWSFMSIYNISHPHHAANSQNRKLKTHNPLSQSKLQTLVHC